MTDSEIINLRAILKAPGMSDAALRAVSAPAASLAAWLWAVLRYRLAQLRGLPTGLLLRQIEATLAREQAQLANYQFRIKETLERNLALTKQLEAIQVSHGHLAERFSWTQTDQSYQWPIKSALLAPMHSWTSELQVTSPSQMSPQSSFLYHCPHSSSSQCPPCLPLSHSAPLPCFPPYPALPLFC